MLRMNGNVIDGHLNVLGLPKLNECTPLDAINVRSYFSYAVAQEGSQKVGLRRSQ